MSHKLAPKKSYANKPEGSDAPPAGVVSPEANQNCPEHVHADTAQEKGKIKHAAQLLPEEMEEKDKKRTVDSSGTNDAAASTFVTPPPTKRRRTDAPATIQRSPAATTTSAEEGKEEEEAIPKPPTDAPPEPTKYMKMLLLGPPAQSKTAWIQGLNNSSTDGTSASSATSNNHRDRGSFTVQYQSKDYSFESSSGTQETVRLQLYSTDCTLDEEPPSSWKRSLLPMMQHTVLVLDLFQAPDTRESLRQWKAWLERHVAVADKSSTAASVPVSLLFVDSSSSNNNKSSSSTKKKKPATSPSSWARLSATVDKVCTDWPNVNKWYLVDHHPALSPQQQEEETGSSVDVILQTMIERSWSANGKEEDDS